MKKFKMWLKSGKNAIIFVPVMVFAILVLSVGSYYGYSLYDQYREEQTAISESLVEEQRQIQSSSLAEEERQRQEAALAAELQAMRDDLDRETFFEGLYLDGIELSAYSFMEAYDVMNQREMDYRENFGLNVEFNDEKLVIDAEKARLETNWRDLLAELWRVGRDADDLDDEETLRQQHARVMALQTQPYRLESTFIYEESFVKEQIVSFASSLEIEAKPAYATGFDTSSKTFILNEKTDGRRMNGEEVAVKAIDWLNQQKFGDTLTLQAEVVSAGMDAATIQANTGFLSEAKTYAEAVNPGRDENIRLIASMTNGAVLQPGETFSFNGYIGRRTADRGFKAAGVIVGGVLVDQLGGGICQPNTTLFQAAAKAGLDIVERYPHSWPSTYTAVGIDATVSWGGPDFKFRNNTDYPVAIMSWYKKPAVVYQIYGLQFDEGVTVKLDVKHHGYTPIPDPEIKETFNPDLKPGERVVLRSPYIGQRTTAYRVFMKNGSEIKREVVAESYYRPLQGLVEYGPEKIEVPEETEETEEPDVSEEPADENDEATSEPDADASDHDAENEEVENNTSDEQVENVEENDESDEASE